MSGGPDSHDTSVERLTPVARRLLLLRHGQTEYNAGSRMQASSTPIFPSSACGKLPPRRRCWPSDHRC